MLPLGVLGESMGVVAIGYRRRQPFDAVQRSFLELVATLLAYVIDQSGAYAREHAARAEAERTSAQLRLLQRFASDLSTADTSRRVADILLRRIVGSTGAFGGAVVSTVRAPHLETIATVGLDGEAVDAVSDVATWLLEDDRWNDERIVLDLDVLPGDRAAPLAARGVGGLAGYLVESATSRIGLVLVAWLGASPRAGSS